METKLKSLWLTPNVADVLDKVRVLTFLKIALRSE